MSDEDLDFENPLDKISFGFQSENGAKPEQTVTLPPNMMKPEKNLKSPMPILNKINNHIKQSEIPNLKVLAQPSISGPSLRPILPKQQIIPIPQTMNLPHTMNNGAPQQYLIVRPLNPANPKQAKTIAIPMGGQFRMGAKQEMNQVTTNNAQILRTPSNPECKPDPAKGHVKMVNLQKIPAQITMTNNTVFGESLPPPLVSTSSHPISACGTNVNGQIHVNASPCPSPGSATSARSPCKFFLVTFNFGQSFSYEIRAKKIMKKLGNLEDKA